MTHRFAMYTVVIWILASIGRSSSAADLTSENLFDPNRVTSVSIELPADDWKTLRNQSRDPGKAFSGVVEEPFTWFKGDFTIDGIRVPAVQIRKKGFIGSLDDRHPSLKVKFEKGQSPIDGIDVLTLNNNKQDSSLLSQLLAYQLFNAAGVKAPRCSFVRVTVNSEDLGLYLNVESIGKPFLKRRFGNDTGNLYEGTLADFYPRAVHRLEVKGNKEKHDASKINRLAALLADKESLDLDEVERLVDVDNFLRFWAIESLIGFWDGYSNNQNNYWVYENKDNGKFYFMPWGADGAFMQSGFPGFGPGGPVSVYTESMLSNRLYRHEKTAQRYRETMRWVLANVWKEEELLQTIDHFEQLVSKDLHRRQSGTPRAINSVRNFVRTRRKHIEKELDAWPVRSAERPRKPSYPVEVGTASGSFSTAWSDKPPGNIAATGTLKWDFKIDGSDTVVFKQQGASSHKRPQPGFPFGFGGPPQPPTAEIVFSGIRESDGKAQTITLSMPLQQLSSSAGQQLEAYGSYSGGDPQGQGFGPFGGKIVTGTLNLTKVDLTSERIVEGSFQLTISEIRGGFMDRRPGPGGPGGPPPFGPPMFGPGGSPASLVSLVAVREVQDELSLTEDQRMQIRDERRRLQESTGKIMSGFREAFELPEEERPQRFASIRESMEKTNKSAEDAVRATLNEAQQNRIKQLMLQREGVNAFLGPEMGKLLELTEPQKTRLQAIQEASRAPGPFPNMQTDEQRRKSITEAVAVLNQEQTEKWQSAIGKDFRFPDPAPFGAPPNGPMP